MKAIWKTPDRFLLFLLFSVFILIVSRNAWVSDDAYITFRTVDNFINGQGLTWNAGERVQSYTHPLWMFLLSLFYLITREVFYTSIFLSIATSAIAVYLMAYNVSKSMRLSAVAVAILTFSMAYVDYSTSGLENPLSHLLLVIFFLLYLSFDGSKKSIRNLAFVASLTALNRLDNLLLVAPALFYLLWQNRNWRTVTAMMVGFIPLITWELFSLFYYGFLWPNTAYAKLATGVSWTTLVSQGFYYLWSSLKVDPITIVVILTVVVLALKRKKWQLTVIVIGILLYLVYVVRIGGCFMSGRFLTAPLLLSVILISQFKLKVSLTGWWLPVAAVLVLGLGSSRSPIYTTASYRAEKNRSEFGRGIVDERGWYFQTSSLLNPKVETHRYARQAITRRTPVTVRATIGYYGFFAGPGTYVIDVCGLGDPLLARLPFDTSQTWRIGHNLRAVPEGYRETILFGENMIKNQGLAQYYDHLALVVSGDLFEWKRLVTIAKLNLGAYDHLLTESGEN